MRPYGVLHWLRYSNAAGRHTEALMNSLRMPLHQQSARTEGKQIYIFFMCFLFIKLYIKHTCEGESWGEKRRNSCLHFVALFTVNVWFCIVHVYRILILIWMVAKHFLFIWLDADEIGLRVLTKLRILIAVGRKVSSLPCAIQLNSSWRM